METDYIKQIPIPACIVSTEGVITAANPMLKDVWVYDDILGSNFFALTGIKRHTLVAANESELWVERGGRKFQLRVNHEATLETPITVFFEEKTLAEKYRIQIEDEKSAVAFIRIDNYDELLASLTEETRRVIPSQIDGIVRRWGDSYDSPVMSKGEHIYIMLSRKVFVDKMIEDNFTVLDEVRNIETEIEFPLSISIGIGLGDGTLSEIADMADEALDLALGRGGDQAVVRTDHHTKYYGGTLQALEKNNRGKARVVAHVLKHQIDEADKVLIMGHKWPDMDSFGSAIGAYTICRQREKEAYIVINQHNDMLDAIYKHAIETDDYKFIKSDKALKMVTDKTLLIIVDVNRPILMECAELTELCKTKVIIDHHRMTEDSIQNTTVAYIESYASSSSELMAELIQNISTKRFTNRFESEALMAGIMVDSNNFSGRTGVRTFEAASWLRRGGADTTAVKRFFQMEADEFKTKANALAMADFEDGFAYAITDGNTGNTQIINAQVADELLMVKGVRASVVMGQNEKGQTILSARSLGDINVQALMERFGGGGHLNSAAAQIDAPAEEVDELLKKYVKEIIDRENEKQDK